MKIDIFQDGMSILFPLINNHRLMDAHDVFHSH